MNIQDYRTTIDNFILKETKNLFISAGAGCGKTTTIVDNYKKINTGMLDIGFLAFNKSIADELKTKGVDACTFHSLGLRLIKKANPKVQVENRKIYWLIEQTYGNSITKDQKAYINRVISLIKNTLIFDIDQLIEEYSLDMERVDDEMVMKIFNLSNKDENVIDFDDMIYRAIDLKRRMFDVLFVDESQDLNNAQIQLITGISDRYIFVGDKFQSIYGFRGANTQAVDDIISNFQCSELSLPVTWRCPIEHVERINHMFPEIPFINGNNRSGIIKTNSEDLADLILCRFNAPLVSLAFKCIKNGIKVTIRGRDIGKNLIGLIDKSKQTSISMFIAWLNDWKNKELNKPNLSDAQTNTIIDKFECLDCLSSECSSIVELKTTIENLFSDEKKGLMLSSVHRAKGLEADSVKIIKESSTMKISNQAARDQERNIRYVANTRSKHLLIINKD